MAVMAHRYRTPHCIGLSGAKEVAQTKPDALFGYEIVRQVGEGAGSVVYKALDREGKAFALKHVVRTGPKDQRLFDQLRNEYEIGRSIDHSSLRKSVALHVRRNLFPRRIVDAALVMEYFDGIPFPTFPVATIPRIMRCFADVGRSLLSLHGTGIVHCDLKTGNILVDRCGKVSVIDLGQACPIGTRKPRIQGTPDFMAPEQYNRDPMTRQTDVYNFGACLYYALTGQPMPTVYTAGRGENSILSPGLIATPWQINTLVPTTLSELTMSCVRLDPKRRPEMEKLVSVLDTMADAVGEP